MREFSAKANELTLVGVGVVFVTTMLMLMRMEESFNRIWHVANTRSGWSRFFSYWGIVSFGVPMIGVAVTAASYEFGVDYLAHLGGSSVMEGVRGATCVPPAATALTFTLLYYAVPSCRVKFAHALVGGIVATVLLTFAKEVFAWAVPWFQLNSYTRLRSTPSLADCRCSSCWAVTWSVDPRTDVHAVAQAHLRLPCCSTLSLIRLGRDQAVQRG